MPESTPITPNSPSKPLVAVVFSARTSVSRDILGGIKRYQTKHNEPWLLNMSLGTGHLDLESIRSMGCDGLILPNGILRQVDGRWEDLPEYVAVVGMPGDDPFVHVYSDQRAVAQRGAEYLMGLGLRQLVYFHAGSHARSAVLREAFIEAADQAGVSCEVFLDGPRIRDAARWTLVSQIDDLADRLRALPKPIGLLACDEIHGERALAACQSAGLSVPDEVAVLAADNDDAFCEICTPALSSIANRSREVGYQAAALLGRMLNGETLKKRHHPQPPLGVIERESTGTQSIPDPHIAKAVAYIQRHIRESITVDDVVAQLPMSRNTLNRRFVKVLGRSPGAEIQRTRLRLAKRMLLESEKPLTVIAFDAGYADTAHFCRALKKDSGLTPSAYRQQFSDR